jgi:hypothetical protein
MQLFSPAPPVAGVQLFSLVSPMVRMQMYSPFIFMTKYVYAAVVSPEKDAVQ